MSLYQWQLFEHKSHREIILDDGCRHTAVIRDLWILVCFYFFAAVRVSYKLSIQ
jgi:hypothetical protein